MDSRFVLPVNTILEGDYRVLGVVGSGGFGITYEAEDINLGTMVAIKEYYPLDFGDRDSTMSVRPKSERHKATFEKGLTNFLQEGRTLARFEHPSIVRVTRVFEANSTAYMVMRFEKGMGLETWLKSLHRPPTQQELDFITAPLLDVMEMMHAADFLHRDIAPDNIIVRADGTPVLLDFGAARRAVAAMSRSLTGIIKAGYSPHEQYAADGRLQGPWSDIYAFGGTLYRAVTGMPPEEAALRIDDDRMPTAKQAAKADYRPSFLEGIDACLRVKASDRPRSIAELRPMLLGPEPHPKLTKPVVGQNAGSANTRSGTRRARRAWPAIAAAAVLLIGAYGGLEYRRWLAEQDGRAATDSAVAQRQADAERRQREKEAADARQHQLEIEESRRRKEMADAAGAEARRQAQAQAEAKRKEQARIAALEEARRKEDEARYNDEAEKRRIAALEGEARRKQEEEAQRKAEAELRARDRVALARSLQTALNRVGCYSGEADGEWTPKGRAALAQFAKIARLDLATDEPTMAALEVVVSRTGRVCPLECGDDKMESEGRCVPKPRKVKTIAKSEPVEKKRSAEPRETRPPTEKSAAKSTQGGSGRSCGTYGFWSPGETCRASDGKICTITGIVNGKTQKTCN